jgi:cation transport ATPase
LTFITIFVGSLSFTFWLLISQDISFALERLVTVLVIACPLAAGILAFKGILLSPALGAIFMSLSTIIVAINALRLKNASLN